jgi:hypothetical protein
MKQKGFHRWNKIHRVEKINWMSDEDWVDAKSLNKLDILQESN